MPFFSYPQLILSHPLLNILTQSEGGFPCQFQPNCFPSHPIHICINLNIPVHLHLQFFPHPTLSFNPSLHIYLYPPFYPHPVILFLLNI